MKSNHTTRRRRRNRFGIATAMGIAALAAPAAAPADVSVKVGSAEVSIPVGNCERVDASTPDSQTVTVPEINAPVYVGPIVPELGAVTVTLPDKSSTQVPIGGQILEIEVGGELVGEQNADTPASAEAEGPEASDVDQGVTLPASAELVGTTTPEDVRASSCHNEPTPAPETPDTEEPPAEQPSTEEPRNEQPSGQPQPEQPQQSTQRQPEQSQSTEQPPAQTESPAQQTQQPTGTQPHRPAVTTGKSKKAKKKAAKKPKKKAAKKGKKSKKNKKNKRR